MSRKDGHHQQHTAIAVTTLPGVGTAVRELKTRRGPTAKAERSEAGRRVGGENGTRCKWKVKKTPGRHGHGRCRRSPD